MSKLTTLDQLKTSLQASKTYIDAQDAVLSSQIAEIVADIEGIVATGGEANILEGFKVNGEALAITDKMVDLLIASGEENGTISVNGAAVAIAGLKEMAFKSEITEAELSEALRTSIASHATQADLSALEVRVTTAEGKIQTLESAGFQNAEQVAAAIQEAIAGANHLKYEIVDVAPSAESADANTWYMVMNEETGHYDIYGLLNGEVRIIDDTTIDLTGYSTTEAMQAWVTQQITALNVDQYATDEELNAVIVDVSALQAALANVYTKTEVEAKLAEKMNVADMGTYATDEEAATAAANAVTEATASDEEVSTMLDEVFG